MESAADAAVAPGYDALNRAWLASALLTLRGFAHHLCVACNSYSWNVIAGHQKRTSGVFREQLAAEGVDAAVYAPTEQLPPFTGQLLDYHLRLLSTESAVSGPVTHEDAAWIRQHFDSFDALAAQSEKFRFALEAAIDWRYAKDARAGIARLWSGIEAVFGISSELVFRVSLLAAALLSPRGPLRKEKFEAVKKLYGIRSKAVHGEALSEELLSQGLADSWQLLRELLLVIVEKGHPLSQADLDDAVFG